MDHSHSTLDCIALCLEVSNLLKRGHLQYQLFDKGKGTLSLCDNQQTDHPVEPTPERIVNVITGGTEVSGITYSAARWHARAVVNLETNSSPPPSYMATNQVITFVDNENSTLINPHHDALVISLLIANCRIKRVLVDNGSSTNVLFINDFKQINIEDSSIHRHSMILVEFKGE